MPDYTPPPSGGGGGASITSGDTTVEITDTGTGYVAITIDGTEIARFTDDGLLLTDADNGDPVLTIRNTGTGSNEPEIRFERTGTGAASQDIGHIKWFANDDGGNNTLFANIFADAYDETNSTEDGRIIFEVAKAGTTDVEHLRIDGPDGVTVAAGVPFRARRLRTVNLSSNTVLTEATHAGRYCFVTGSSRTITLPANPGAGVHFTLLSNDANGFTLTSTDNMNGSSSDITVDARNGVTCISDGSNYVVLGA